MSASLLVVTNDFPPRAGGIEAFVENLVRRLPAHGARRVVVHTRRHPALLGAQRALDAELATAGVVVVRDPRSLLLPTPALARRVAATARAHGCDRAWFGAAAPLGVLAPALRRAGVRRTVATTHGHEVWWARLPGSRAALRAVAARNDVLTVLGPATGGPIAAVLPAHLRARVATLSPGVDPAAFGRPEDDDGGRALRAQWGLTGRPLVLCLSRLVARKGQDVLLRALPAVQRAVPDAALVLVGEGPRRRYLEHLADSLGLRRGPGGDVVLTGRLPAPDLAAAHAAADVFAMPCRDRRGGLETEGLGICFLEAAASGRPVVVGRSGGAPDAVRDGETGLLVDGTAVAAVAAAVTTLLADPALAHAMGEAGQRWIRDAWDWEDRAAALAQLLEL
ncbi:phosphatidylinositol alpha-1,6-mannosyltransferase [Quadrisphaera granulorum]|uniref:Phosphatidylinositol alpha-1,6-mannosyltransferase n=1 Tax=Quadrisphaera granulorum TaxID=317664 RepID=A0A315ZX76_9ACTN|nr:glycosyltransferase family 4 protein [Quadrisphaera granulorum]PWJ49883.1 phosphatidylinositol alpha-1,6-mannosyltransferase [Quadrisphaera granulorum]SZE98091.1 phosphatidylinositol alpha-1,6-mannosyltransferase [Quadrisphaera granulorum]